MRDSTREIYCHPWYIGFVQETELSLYCITSINGSFWESIFQRCSYVKSSVFFRFFSAFVFDNVQYSNSCSFFIQLIISKPVDFSKSVSVH